jgi:DNA-binding transcriptional LysR family regulator
VKPVNLKTLDLNLLVVFDVVYATRNISRAAEQLAMSQPAVSNALARLREILDDQLFLRGRRGVEPTLRANEIAATVREALQMIGRQLAPAELDLSTYRRHFRLIMPDVFEPIMMPPVLREIYERAPGVTVEGLSAFRTDFIKEIRDGVVDLAVHVFPAQANDIVSEPICETDIVLLTRRGHPLVGKSLDIKTLGELGYVVLVPELQNVLSPPSSFLAHGIKRREVYAANKLWALPAIIERTDLAGLMPRWFFREMADNYDIVPHEMPIEMQKQHCCMTWHIKNTNDPGHTWLRESLKAAFRKRLDVGTVADAPLPHTPPRPTAPARPHAATVKPPSPRQPQRAARAKKRPA